MWECFFPDSRAVSAYEIAYETYYEKGYRGIIFDIDNTLVEHGRDAIHLKRLIQILNNYFLKKRLLSLKQRNYIP